MFFQSNWFIELEIALSAIGIGFYIGVAIFMTIVYSNFANFYLLMAIWSFIPLVITACWTGIASLKGSGRPVIDQVGSKNYDFVRKRLLFWTIGKVARGIICVKFFFDGNRDSKFDWPTCVLCLLSNYLSEIFPIFLILDVNILKALFGSRERDHTSTLLVEDGELHNSHESKSSSLQNTDHLNPTTLHSASYRAIDYNLLRFIENSDTLKKKYGFPLGRITKAYYNSNEVRVREIGSEDKKVSHYMFDEVVEEFSQFK
jgi:hypothetical protein